MLRYWIVCVVLLCFHWIVDADGSNNYPQSLRHHGPQNTSLPHHERTTRGIRTAVSNKPTERCYGTFGCYSVNRPWTSSNRPINNFPEAPEIIQPAFCLYTRHNRSRCQVIFLNFLREHPGAHLAGYTGQYLRDRGHMLGRITGMDPADPYFENTEPLIRLDPTDALFVDVIHTDAGPILSGGLGMMQPVGHIDFYPNGGVRQPGCGTSVLDSIEKERGSVLYGLSRFIGCNHLRSVEFFTESFNSACPFLAVQCPSFEDFLEGRCHCGTNACHRMGYSADHQSVASSTGLNWPGQQQTDDSIQMYLLTRDDQPFCLYHYRVTIVISDTFESIQHGGDRGWLSIQLHGHNRSSPPTRLTPENVRFEPRRAYSYVLGSTWLGDIKSVTLVWTYSSSVFNPLTWRILTVPALHVNRIIVHNLESNSSAVICGEDTPISSKESRQMFPDSKCRHQSWLPAAGSFHFPTDETGANGLRKSGKRSRRLQLG